MDDQEREWAIYQARRGDAHAREMLRRARKRELLNAIGWVVWFILAGGLIVLFSTILGLD